MRAEILKLAASEIGYTESPAGSNLNKFGEWYGVNGKAWCAMFVSYILSKVNFKWPVMLDGPKGFSWVPTLYVKGKANSWLTSDPEGADIILYDWEGDGQADHVGFFVCWIEKGKTFFAIEGNTSPNNRSNGGAVMLMPRSVASVQAFIKLPNQ